MNVVEVNPLLDKPLFDNIIRYSHGMISDEEFAHMYESSLCKVISINDRLFCGIMWNDSMLGFFGFHSTDGMHEEDLALLDEYSMALAKQMSISKIQFMTPRFAWRKILKPMGYVDTIHIFEKEL